jgi:hypothetical protein
MVCCTARLANIKHVKCVVFLLFLPLAQPDKFVNGCAGLWRSLCCMAVAMQGCCSCADCCSLQWLWW